MRQTFVKLLHVVADPLLVAFDGEQVVTAFLLNYDLSCFGLGVHCVGGIGTVRGNG